jgi:hypothetical protein
MQLPRDVSVKQLISGLAVVMLYTSSINFAGAAPFSGELFGTDAIGGHLLRINTVTGAGTIVGTIGFPVPSLAFDPITGILYGGEGAGIPNLYTVNPATGAATLVGNTGLGLAAIGGMDFRTDGVLFAAVNIIGDGGTGSETLATINKATGLATIVGFFGVEGMEAIAFDSSGVLWGARSASGAGVGIPGLYTINTSTGQATFVEPIVSALGLPPSGGVVSLQFATDGRLFGGTATPIGAVNDGGRLITIDRSTGIFSFVGVVPATPGGVSLGALAGTTSARIPEPSALSLLGVGVAALLVAYHRCRLARARRS